MRKEAIVNFVNRKVIRGIIHKKCGYCGTYVPETEFHVEHNRWDDRQGYCKKCKAIYMHNYHRNRNGRAKRIEEIDPAKIVDAETPQS